MSKIGHVVVWVLLIVLIVALLVWKANIYS